MKKSIIAVSLIAAALLTACGNDEPAPDSSVSGETAAETTASVDTESAAPAAAATAADITAAVTAEIEIPSAVEKDISNIGAFYDVDTAAVTDISVLICGSGAYPDELAVFRFTDAEAANNGAEAVQKRLDSQTELYSDYTPDEMYKLEDAFVITKGEWVAMAVCSDNTRAKEIIENMLP